MLGTLASKSPSGDDLEIIFKKDGEAVSIFVPVGSLQKGKAKDDAQRIMNNVACAICCSQKKGFGACLARCLDDGKCCDNGATNCD